MSSFHDHSAVKCLHYLVRGKMSWPDKPHSGKQKHRPTKAHICIWSVTWAPTDMMTSGIKCDIWGNKCKSTVAHAAA